jgi:16S rRNA (cytidine1402-2'-O)-methyltransferase
MIFYESPHRIMKTLESLMEHLNGNSDNASPRRVTVCRELTKIFEEVVQGTAKEVKNYFEEHQDKVRGEFVVIVSK